MLSSGCVWVYETVHVLAHAACCLHRINAGDFFVATAAAAIVIVVAAMHTRQRSRNKNGSIAAVAVFFFFIDGAAPCTLIRAEQREQ